MTEKELNDYIEEVFDGDNVEEEKVEKAEKISTERTLPVIALRGKVY